MATVSDGRYFLRLYVAGANARSREALKRIFQLCEGEQEGNYELEVIDVYQQPELARQDQIVATPTLVKFLPLPVRKYIGNLSETPGLFGEPKTSVEIPKAP
jgi:circadian clock protein KaiB